MKKLSLLFAALLAVSMSFATTVTKTVNELVTENEWTVSAGSDIGTLATNFALDNVVTVSTTGTPNCGSIWGTTTNDWRLYQNQNGNVTITAAEGYTLSIVKLTFNVAKTGVLLDAAGNTVASNSEIEVNAQNVTFTVGNSGTATNGQVKITAFEVTYLAVGDSTIIPVDTTIVPVDTTIVPVDTTIVPVDTTIVPVDTTIVPVDTIALNCAEAREAALALDHNTPSTGIYAVTGYITEVVGNVSRNQQTFWMADTLEGGRVFEGYWANLPEGVEAFVEGMQIRMTGNLMRYNSTPEMKNGTVEILALPVVPDDTTIIPVDTTIVPVDTTIVPVDTIALNCAEAREAALALDHNTPSTGIYAVTGYITEVVGNVSRNQQTFWMADSLEGGRVFEGYWANLPEGIEAFEVGMQVRMTGNLMRYNSTPEMKNGTVEILAMPIVPEPLHYFIKNNWNGGEWAWVEMNMVMDNVLYEYTGVFGGMGVNINTAAADAGSTWFSVENFSVLDSTFVPQALDTIHFVYSIVDSVLAVELVGRPAPAPARYFIKNNWNGAADWTWVEMNMVMDNVLYEYTGVFGGMGVNINTAAADAGSTWFSVENFSVLDSTYVPQALDTLHFVYSIVDSVLAVELVGRPAPAPARYFIKNNWNGAADWTWVEMNMVMDNVLYEYTGVFGGTGVNINTAAADAGSTWFSVENFSVLDSTFVPQALDTLHFVYSIVDSVLAVELVGRPEPIIIDSVTTILNITDVTGWENLYVYAWGGAEIFGSWPGEIALEQIIISGNYEGQTEHLIFNNGAGTQLADFDIVLMDTVYNIVVRADGAYFPEDVPTTNTCAEVNAITEATNMTLGEVTVVFAKGSNIYVQDATATTLVYTNKYADLVPGDRVQGIAGQAKLYYGLPELAATTEFADLVVTAGQAPRIPDAKTAPTMADINKVMMFRNVTMLDSAFTTPNNKAMNINGIFNGDTVTFRNNWKDTYTFEQGKTYTMLGCVAVYNNAIQVYVTNIEEYVEVPVQYYIKNNWNGGSTWTWEEMSPVLDNVLYEYTGVFGGTGVNINTTTADEDAIWFPVENFSLIDSTYVPQALDTIHFVYSIVDATLAVELVGRPAGDSVLHYYIKNNWEAGSEWTWVEMDMVVDSAVYEYTGVFGGTGVNINTMATDAGAIWFPVEDFRTIDSTYVPQALDTIHFVYSIVDAALAVELVGRPVIEEIQYYIKNNWNGGEWTWEEMTPANDGNITWTYRGIFGGTGVNINNLPIDADAIWFPVDEWLFTTLGYVPEAGDDILFEFDSELLTLTATFMGKDGLETITFQHEGETMKLIHNGQLYIIRDGKMYNALGAQVR